MSDVKVTIFTDVLIRLDEAAIRALEKTAEAVHTEVVQAQVIPRDTGHLQNDATYVDTSNSSSGHVDLVSSTPYARRLYYHPEYNFSRAANANAGAGWFDPWAEGGSKADFATNAFGIFFKREGGV